MVHLTFLTIAFVSCLSFTHASLHNRHPTNLHIGSLTKRARTRANLPRCKASVPIINLVSNITSPAESKPNSGGSGGCFPALGFQIPAQLPAISNWWCSEDTEYGFLGFSYDISGCQSSSQLKREFALMRNTYNARYVRLYGTCEGDNNYYNKVVDAAYASSIGVYALIWFGFNSDNVYEGRRDALANILLTNEKAKYVTRAVSFGSEALFDSAITPGALAKEIRNLKDKLAGTGILVTTSEMSYGFTKDADLLNSALGVLDQVDFMGGHALPFFDPRYTNVGSSWQFVQKEIDWYQEHLHGKKLVFTQAGMPWMVTSGNTQPSNKGATTSKSAVQTFYRLFNEHCSELKSSKIGYFAHLFSDNQQDGYGVLDPDMKPNFKFNPETTC